MLDHAHRIFTIRQRDGDRQFISRSDRAEDALLSIDSSLSAAVANARRAARTAAAVQGCRILIMAENSRGFLERVAVVDPRSEPDGDGSMVTSV